MFLTKNPIDQMALCRATGVNQMVEVNQKGLAVLIALSIVCLISIALNFVTWMLDWHKEEDSSLRNRWKWMCVLTVFIVAVLQMARG